MRWYIRTVDTMNDWIGRIGCLLLLPLVIIVAIEVFMRYVINQPTIWAWDVNIQIFSAITFFSGGYALLEKGHVNVDVFTFRMAPRKRAIIDLITSFFFFFGMIVLCWKGWEIFQMSWGAKEHMPTIWAPPYYWMKLFVPVGSLLLLLQGVSEFLKNLNTVFSGNSYEKEEGV